MSSPALTPAVRTAPSNLFVRILTAALAAPLIVLNLYFGPVWSWYGLVLFCTIVAGAEFFRMTHPGDRIAQAVGVGLCVMVSLAYWFGANDARVLTSVALLLPVAAILLGLARLGEIPSAATRMAATVFGPVWIGMLTCLGLLRRDLGAFGPGYVVLALLYAWLADTGGYFAGRFLGRHKLYPAVSPKKTVEGFVGALAGAALGAVLAHFWYLPSIPLGDALGMAVLVGALGQAGDLGESLIKRAVGVKDSGGIVPGHGGILDRVDALFITSAMVYVYTRWR